MELTTNVPNLGTVKYKKLSEHAKQPVQGTSGSVGYDLFASKSIKIATGQVAKVETGLAFELPNNVKMDLRPRSSFGSRNILIANSPATIDSDYRGEVKVLIKNDSGSDLVIERGDKMAQAVYGFRFEVDHKEVDMINSTVRGEGGFGSTGAK